MTECACPGCHTAAKNSCSACAKEHYCSSNCQKLDWKTHKSMCSILKKLSNKLQSYREVVRIINDIKASKKGNNVRVLEHLLSYAEHQFGKVITGKSYRERGDGERMSNWDVEFVVLNGINKTLADCYIGNNSLSTIRESNDVCSYLERSLSRLNPWLIYFDSDATNRIDGLNGSHVESLLKELFNTERSMATVTTNRRQFDIAEGHCERSLAYSRRLGVEGEEKTSSIFRALSDYCSLRNVQGDYSSAVIFAEECYNLVVVAYNPVHPQCQEAAGILIHMLIAKGDYSSLVDAFRFALVTYSNLRDSKNGMDQDSEEVANGAYNLADVIHRQNGDLIKAEQLTRESLRIRTLIYGSDHQVGISCNLLARILMSQNLLGDETRELFECSIAICIRNEGPDALTTAAANLNIGEFYHNLTKTHSTVDLKRTQLLLAKSHYEEAHRIRAKIHGPTHPYTVQVASLLATVLREL